jgi:outer membrane cobalamin receptor
VLGIVLLGCTTRARDTAQNPPPGGQFVTAEQIQASAATTAWEALKYTVRTHRFSDYRGRPVRVYSARGQGSIVLREEPLLFLDGTRLTDLIILRAIPANNIYSIQVLTGPDATTYFGTSAVAGVILLETTMGAEDEDSAEVDTTVSPRDTIR